MGNVTSTEAPPPGTEPLIQASHTPSALVIVGPSGVGKGTLINKLKEGNDKFGFSCSHTTRKPRDGEQNGVHYHFIDKESFEKEIAEGKFLEYAYVHSNIYGTSIKSVQDVAAAGNCCILDIDVQGARQVRASGLPAIFVFVAPPSLDVLERRLRGRGTETEEQITTRLKSARDEMASLEEVNLYDHVLINNDLEACFKEIVTVADRALAGETGPPADSELNTASSSFREPASATVSLRGWLGDTGSPVAASEPTEQGTNGGNNAGGVGGNANAALMHAGLLRWKGRVALVTGASGAVGWAVALALASAGIKVVAVSRRKAQLESLQEAAAGAGVPLSDFLPVVCDLTKEAEVTALPRIVARRWPGLGIELLVNAVGSGKKAGESSTTAGSKAATTSDVSLLTGSSTAWVEAVSAGVLGTALVCREVVADMRKRGEWGHIVNVTCCNASSSSSSSFALSSSSGDHSNGRSVGGMQAVSTAAARALTEELRVEAQATGAGVKVSSVATGSISVDGQQEQGALAVDDVVAAVVFVLSAPPHVDVSEVVVRPVGVRAQQ